MGSRKYSGQTSGGKPHETSRDIRPGVQTFRDANAEAERKKVRVAELRARLARR